MADDDEPKQAISLTDITKRSSCQSNRMSQQSRCPVTAPTVFNKAKTDMMSYENLIVHRYLENIKKERLENQEAKQVLLSPYLQRLPHSHLTTGRCRPASVTLRSTLLSSHKPKIDAKFIADSALWEPATPREVHFRRPESAPVRRLRPHSAVSQRAKGSKSIYRKQPHVIKASVFINGSRDKFIHVAAPNIKTLLEFATEKLELPFAARRIFTEDGVEVLSEEGFPSEGDIYVSMGEGFKEPYYAAKKNTVIRNGAVWNLKGIVLPENGNQKSSKTRLSKRLRALCENKKVRILVYKNGQSSSAAEVVADLKNIQDFFTCCTARLDLCSSAKIAFDWDGNEITDLADTPVFNESIMQQWKTPLLGPLWMSTGERFSPSGTQNFLLTLKHALKNRIKIAKQRRQNITFALDNEKVTDVAVLSLSIEELYQASEKVDEELDKLKESVALIKKKLEALQEDVLEEEAQGMKYRLSHIQEISANDRLVGTRGCRLKVFENGRANKLFSYYFNIREALRGLDGNNIKEKLMQRLLDELSSTRFSEGVSRNLNAVATTLYDKNGCEITDVLALEQQQAGQVENNVEQPETCVWMSFGEPYICPFTYALHLFLDKVTGCDENEDGESKILTASVTAEDEHLVRDSSKLEAINGLPSMYEVRADSNIQSCFLQHKEEKHFVLYPEIGVAEKFTCKNQQFVYTESGHIYCKAAPQLCLAVSDTKFKTRILNKHVTVEGFAVCMQSKSFGSPCQIWRCTPDATVYSEIQPNLLLTYLGTSRQADGCEADSDLVAGDDSEAFLIVAEPLPNKAKSAQRFAFKQEHFHNLGQWKKTEHSNPEWNKLAYSWPVKANGELNKNYDWPMEGFIIPYAPPMQKLGNKPGLSGITPVRLRVLKNFEPNVDLAVSVVGPNVTNMMTSHTRNKHAHKKGRKHETSLKECENVDLHCVDLTVAEMEFQMFLQNCTNLLNLPHAGRRLFSNHGKELFTIQNLEKDSLVYVSCGEQWAGTNLSCVEQRRRILLSQLTADVDKIKQYCSLRNPENYVIEVSGPLAPKSGLVVNKLWSREAEAHSHGAELSAAKEISDQLVSKSLDDESEAEQLGSDQLTAHQRAHLQSEERLSSLKWPWERLVNVTNSMDMDDPEANKYTDRDLYEKFKPQAVTHISRDTLQKFEFVEEYLSLVANQNLVLSISETEGRVMGVALAKRRPDDINQRWVIKENGEIRARHNQNMVLTVCMPTTADGESATLSFAGCPVTLQSKCVNTFGKAHQMWRYDAETGLILAFQSNSYDKEITAANKADVCTYAIAQAADIDQPGYQVEVDSQKHSVCMSCARSMRGRYKVQRLPPNTNFHCAMGDAKKLKIRQVGPFRVLNNKVDLSTYEADLSLQYWTDILQNLKQQTRVTAIAKEINAARSVLTVKVLVYKNGEGRLRKGEIICGSSIAGILGQCTLRLGMNSAARRMYLEDGSIVLDVDGLVQFAVESYKNDMISTIIHKRGGHDVDTVNVTEKDEEYDLSPQQQTVNGGGNEQLERSNYFNNASAEGKESSEKDQEKETQVDKQERDRLLENIKLPPLEHILRAPVEVWVSSGKAFVSPEVVESKEENLRKKRQLRAQVCLALDIEKHILRQMKGRRLDEMSPGTYESTLSSEQPVVIEKHWLEQTVEEQDKHVSIDKLQSHLGEIRANQQDEKVNFAGINLEGKLYCQPNMKRVIVFPNGASTGRSVYVWGNTIQEILNCAASKLGLWKQPKILYNMEGQKVDVFEDIQRDQLLCVSTMQPFMPPKSQKMKIEVKSNWGRARRMYGRHATDLTVHMQKNPHVDVDPFGAPLLALPDGSSTCSATLPVLPCQKPCQKPCAALPTS